MGTKKKFMKRTSRFFKKQEGGSILQDFLGGRRLSMSFSMTSKSALSIDSENACNESSINSRKNQPVSDKRLSCSSKIASNRVGLEPVNEIMNEDDVEEQVTYSSFSGSTSTNSLLDLISKTVPKRFNNRVGVEPASPGAIYQVNEDVIV